MVRGIVTWVGWRLAGLGIAAMRRLVRLVKSNKALYALVYDFRNSQEFTDLYEHEKMLADPVRVESYAAAIRAQVKPGDRVVDLGTGSGVLALLAARQGARVYAIDHSDFIALAEENARLNGVEGITFVRANSRQFDPPEKVDVLLHEQIGDSLFNENMVENLLDLKRRVLKQGGRILPGRFHLFLEPVSLRPEFSVPMMEEISIDGLDFRHLAKAAEDYRHANYLRRSVERQGIAFFLGEPSPILTVDLNEIEDGNGIPTTLRVSRKVVCPGRLDGLYQYFGVDFGGGIAFDTSPFSTRTHWTNRMFRLPGRDCGPGETLNFTLTMGDLRLPDSWSVAPGAAEPPALTVVAPAPAEATREPGTAQPSAAGAA